MIGEWFAAVPALLVAAALLIVPGYAAARAARLGGLLAWAVAAPASLTVIGLASLVAPLIGMPWSIVPVLVLAVAVIAIAAVVGFFFRAGRSASAVSVPWASVATIGGLVVGAVLLTAQLVYVVGAPSDFSQSFDNVFHLNATRFILDTQNASPLHVGQMTSPSGGVPFYPAGWHASVALVVQLVGCSIPVASNAVMIAGAALVWPAGVVLLSATLFGRRPVVLAAAGVLAAGVPAFPLLMIDYGVLYPFFLAVCALPAVLAVTLLALGLRAPENGASRGVVVLFLVGSLPGLALFHPGAFVGWLFAGTLALLFAVFAYLRTRPARRDAILVLSGSAVWLVVAFVAWRILRPPLEARGWPITETLGQAVGEVATLGLSGGAVPIVLAVLMWIGVIAAVRSRRLIEVYALVTLVMFAVLYVAASAFPWGNFRDLLTAAWYNNAPRLAALIPLIAIPLAAYGVAVVAAVLARLVQRTSMTPRAAVAALVAVAVVVVGASQLVAVREAVVGASGGYRVTPDSALVSTDELALIDKLPELVPEDAVIAGNPWTGTGLAYALADRRVLMPHLLMDVSPDMQVVNDDLVDADDDPSVCPAVEATDVDYLLDFGTHEVHGATHSFPGFAGAAKSPSLRLVDSVGTARLYEVTACGR